MSSPAQRYARSRRRGSARHPRLAEFAAGVDFPLDDFQVRACGAIEDGRGVLVAAPTGAGKTVVGEFAVFLALRLLVYPLAPSTIDPPYWVAMGSVAISVVAGALIVEMDSAPMVDVVRGLVAGLALVLWCFATWLIPVLVALGIRRHAVQRLPLTYHASWWSIVFPLGMYAVAGMYLGRADRLPLLTEIGQWFYWVAAAAWVAAFAAMLRSGARSVLARATTGGP